MTVTSWIAGLAACAALCGAPAWADPRVEIDRTSAEFRRFNAVGTLYTDGGSQKGGTAWIVDDCHVVTAKHVAFADLTVAAEGATVFFSVGHAESQRFAFERVPGRVIAFGQFDNQHETRATNKDWAVIRLAEPIGRYIDVLPIAQLDRHAQSMLRLQTAGFAGSMTKLAADATRLFGDDDCKVLGHAPYGYSVVDCYSTSGNSGSPITIRDRDGRQFAAFIVSGNLEEEKGSGRFSPTSVAAVNLASGREFDVESEGDALLRAIAMDSCHDASRAELQRMSLHRPRDSSER